MKEVKIEKLKKFSEYDRHNKVYRLEDKKTGLVGFLAIHRQRSLFPALGATRLWLYETEDDALRDALRLSKLMSYKAALLGLPYTGAKAVLIKNNLVKSKRDSFFKAYAKVLNQLEGKFLTGTDVGVTSEDVKKMRTHTKYVIGTKVNPAYYTAIGVFEGIKACLEKVYGKTDLSQRSFAIQGLGKSGMSLLDLIYKKSKNVYVSDINEDLIREARKKYPKIKVVGAMEIHKQKVDVFCPCALHGTINVTTSKELNCKIICGSANNQLRKKIRGKKLHELGILYAPDFVVNAGGLISVVDELRYGKPDDMRIKIKLKNIRESLKMIFDESDSQNEAPNTIAYRIGEELVHNK